LSIMSDATESDEICYFCFSEECTKHVCLHSERFSPCTRHRFRTVCRRYLNTSFLDGNGHRYHDSQNTDDSSSEEETESLLEDEAGRKMSNNSESPSSQSDCTSNHQEETQIKEFNSSPSKIECLICTEKVLKKENIYSRVFAFMPNCSHHFCFDCIAKWRIREDMPEEIRLGCPVCRTVSNYVVPTGFWFGTPEKRTDLISCFEFGRRKRLCMSSQHGNHRCAYGDSCPFSLNFNQIIDNRELRTDAVEPRWRPLLENLAALFNHYNLN
ncbi:putative E3 ubiquitin-protein ligase makorin-2, partial [Trichinella papuae]